MLIYLFVVYSKDVIIFLNCNLNDDSKPIEHSKELISTNDFQADSLSYQTLENQEINTLSEPEKENIIIAKPRVTKNLNEKGLLKIAFFFYQAASVIRVSASAKSTYKNMPHIIDVLTSFFNFKIDAQSSNSIDTCPLKTDNVIAIDLLKTSIILTCLMVVVLFIFIISSSSKVKQICIKDDPENFQPRGEGQLLLKLKGAFVRLLLLGYAAIATICLQAVNCIEITGHSYLYVQATIKCYQPWQKGFFAVIGLWAVPFPIAIYLGCRLLEKRKVSANEFLAMLAFPPVTIYYLVKIRIVKPTTDPNQRSEGDFILSILNGPFRYRSTLHEYRIIWEPVLIFRRFLLIVLCTFIISPMEKLYPVGALLLLFILHDIVTKPYANKSLNYIEYTSMLLLCFLLIINQFWAFSNDIDITQIKAYHEMGELFIFLEITILLLPLVILAVIVIFKIGKIIFKVVTRK